MIFGIGVDVVDIERIDEKLATRILTDRELQEFQRVHDRKQFLASRFAVKEAFFKALGTGLRDFSFRDVELAHNELGKPVLVFHRDVQFNFTHVSVSHDRVAMAMVVLERKEGYIYVALGSNVGERLKNIQRACCLMESSGMRLLRTSPVYVTKPYGFVDQPDFLNCVVEIETELTPFQLLAELLNIERLLGRVRDRKWGPRTIDLDIVLYGNIVLESESLTIPHYDLANRQFVLRPLLDISDIEHPLMGKLRSFLKEGGECLLMTKNWFNS
ncbi:MAG: 2-amino-4-hydroxy-6-hydroxymethyldihydropteridine diphosphokinase [Pseudothermotoga sp.]|uniref:2-amino-4-hydroxy-6- hydroxymethyldihydropteridine diphosphokinase n=1 Tax=Pseudothermotoga sp. TaxID=2033661 RepID=UPI00076DE9DB|nr:MAG: 2-amino-4-hydroxy-6-hydroxymethyldihydropteridine pyrophosphokinase [Thermotoga sp. 50_64]MBC7117048.1 2-amino-4-hydroxy-6-hydroxymethyldihydropteridine diphosphokinase [Pseudothermotoga sp.]MDK2923189.1 2-amino-4-hydroxy-6-hydroxymethyldihydropteridine diphosphokinase [Pseudothermotoga sp.]HBT40413.1 7,8-dihydro-6-hydroxymethylpterin-pyrophosphokinase [Pseudothermotoga sp.]HCO97826.1 7,8-dihydro-6-hydroxymethylpterin-pyrophosphokinase [Pseudothermotoga sp.]